MSRCCLRVPPALAHSEPDGSAPRQTQLVALSACTMHVWDTPARPVRDRSGDGSDPACAHCLHRRQVLQLPPAFDLSARQRATASFTAHIAARRGGPRPGMFPGPELFSATLARRSLCGAQDEQQDAAFFSHGDALKHLTRQAACLVTLAVLPHLLSQPRGA